jgi:hypothetical protein
MMHCDTAKNAPVGEANTFREPTLAEMLSDPVIQSVMRADAVDPAELRALLDRGGGSGGSFPG